MSNQKSKSFKIGELKESEKKNQQSGEFETITFPVKNEQGEILEYVQAYSLKVYIPDDVDEAGIGEPSIVLKKGQFINAVSLSQIDKDRMPDFMFHDEERTQCKAAVKVTINRER